jgi:hypothetical protein
LDLFREKEIKEENNKGRKQLFKEIKNNLLKLF